MTGHVFRSDSGGGPTAEGAHHEPNIRTIGNDVRSARWLLPWLIVLAISASVAYAATVAAMGAASAGDARTIISAAHAPAYASVIEGRGGYLTPFIGDATCLGHLGGGNPTQATPEMTAPPAWCRQ
jgi:hypothetical protein